MQAIFIIGMCRGRGRSGGEQSLDWQPTGRAVFAKHLAFGDQTETWATQPKPCWSCSSFESWDFLGLAGLGQGRGRST
jgi:hypothetical protein